MAQGFQGSRAHESKGAGRIETHPGTAAVILATIGRGGSVADRSIPHAASTLYHT